MPKPRTHFSSNSNTAHGFYEIKNVDKYIGDPTKCMYVSSWELRFMIYLDNLDLVHRWASEEIAIPYYLPNEHGHMQIHNYFPDFYVEYTKKSDPEYLEKVVIEVKPTTDINPNFVEWHEDGSFHIKPITSKSPKAVQNRMYQLNEFQKNLFKWDAAKKWCEERNMLFHIVTEQEMIEKHIMPPINKYKRH
jgi:hypothetical protein